MKTYAATAKCRRPECCWEGPLVVMEGKTVRSLTCPSCGHRTLSDQRPRKGRQRPNRG